MVPGSADTDPPPARLSDPDAVIAAVDARLAAFLAEAAAQAARISPAAAELYDPILAFARRGKRIRALALRWGFEAAGGDAARQPGIDDACVAVELLHAAALIHDDIIDESETRRGSPAVHTAFARSHAEHGFSGAPAHFGTAAAIIAGDLCLSLSEQAHARTGLPHAGAPEAVRRHDDLRRDVMLGQFLDIRIQAAPIAAGDIRERAMEVLTYKSAKYSVEQPLLLGAALAGAGPELLAALSAFGLPLGRAFQLRDDELGVFGDPEATGKPAGDDLLQGKRTVLVGMALTRLDAEDAAWLTAHLGDPGIGAADLGRMRELLRASGAVDEHEALISAEEDAAAAALSRLGELGLGDADLAALRAYAGRLTRRAA
ncbi:polyprenyl synthetase family protein [Brevibacterium sp. 5221]|uniref:Polyprenyl synthetase family protein n=1 Tax=Brevibacterium rongguiense TaxID=2695267 RepID=A0A6N9HA75_9MICO|nr:polyprenyl synthetase family protein [Brevibacterium rongguiense]MYM20923.1 polyprenyl synthetase family protein [Brevibacterium rongguiense]